MPTYVNALFHCTSLGCFCYSCQKIDYNFKSDDKFMVENQIIYEISMKIFHETENNIFFNFLTFLTELMNSNLLTVLFMNM